MKYMVWYEQRYIEQAVVEADSEEEAIDRACEGNLFRYGDDCKEVTAELFNHEIHDDIDYNNERNNEE